MKLTDIGYLVGIALIFGPVVINASLNRWLHIGMILIGAILISIAGYNAQAKAIGMGETGEALLQSAWRWFRVRVLREPLPPQALELASSKLYQSVIPRPRRSTLSRWALICGIAFVFMPSLLGWPSSVGGRLFAIGWGSLLIVASQRNLPPTEPDDPPHGQELLEVAWRWIRQRILGRQ